MSFIVVNVFKNSWGCWGRNAHTTVGCGLSVGSYDDENAEGRHYD
jgi:hypothetical protein